MLEAFPDWLNWVIYIGGMMLIWILIFIVLAFVISRTWFFIEDAYEWISTKWWRWKRRKEPCDKCGRRRK